jgi:hypothetical protein
MKFLYLLSSLALECFLSWVLLFPTEITSSPQCDIALRVKCQVLTATSKNRKFCVIHFGVYCVYLFRHKNTLTYLIHGAESFLRS